MINFKISEFINSDVALKNNINNIPNVDSLDNILNLIVYCMQPLRNLLKTPILITSGYRCKELNKKVCGSENSQHLYGCAADFITRTFKPKDIIEIIKKSNIEYDQLINEKNLWIHISFVKNKNRKQILYIK